MDDVLIECSPGISGDMLLGAFYDLGVPKKIIEQPLIDLGLKDLYQLNDFPNNSSKTNFSKLLEELDLKDNYFSVRGELVFVNTQKKEIVIKICPAIKSKNLKNKNFKLVIKGELSLELLHSFVSLDINRDGNSLQLIKYEVIEKNHSKK